jgi:lipopolysaccharide/colanic/teichoic acid biosynthesis glycosyltransferase
MRASRPEIVLRARRERTRSVVRRGSILGDAAKRALDILGASLGLVLLSPVLAWTAVAIAVTSGRPILFRQVRPGLHGKPFTIVKFRTMRSPRPGEVAYLTDAERVTRVGRFLRSSSIDELPELLNVVRGEMSLVGPRPLLTEYLDSYTERQKRRHDVRPGITSLAIIRGRHALRFDERIELDVWYVEHRSLALDLRILLATVSQVIRRTDSHATQDPAEIGFPLPGLAPTAGSDVAAESETEAVP